MADLLLDPDTVALVRAWLKPALTARGRPAPVVSRVPSPRPTRFVTLQRHGGVRATVVTDAPQIGVECWGGTDEEAHDLAVEAHGLLLAMKGAVLSGHVVYRVDEFAGPADLPDPLSEQPRYVFTVQPHIRLTRA